MSMQLVLACLLGTFSVALMMFSESTCAAPEKKGTLNTSKANYKTLDVFDQQGAARKKRLERQNNKAGTDATDGKEEKQPKMLQYEGFNDRKPYALSDLEEYQKGGYRFKEAGVYLFKGREDVKIFDIAKHYDNGKITFCQSSSLLHSGNKNGSRIEAIHFYIAAFCKVVEKI